VGWARSSAAVSYSSPATAPLPANPNAGSASNAPMTKSETGFFKFLRNNTGAHTPPPGSHHLHRDSAGSAGLHTPHSSLDGPSASTPDLLKHQSHLMSPSLPSLHATHSSVNALSTSRREEELAQALQRERASTKKVLEEKRNLEEELESLSQALFEEVGRHSFRTCRFLLTLRNRPIEWCLPNEDKGHKSKRSYKMSAKNGRRSRELYELSRAKILAFVLRPEGFQLPDESTMYPLQILVPPRGIEGR
jgi:hypothetical protein